MNFATLTFVLFCPAVFAIYWSLRQRYWQNVVLILASYFFYGWWDWRFCLLMLASTLVDYFVGIGLGKTTSATSRRYLLGSSLVCNLAILGTFKYFNFFVDNLRLGLSQAGIELGPATFDIILPIGISFYTFQTLSYTIDVYRRRLEPTRNLIDYLAFVSFFPQLVAGPIERAGNLLPQFAKLRKFDSDAARDGCRLILWGLAKKIVLADRLAVVVTEVYCDVDAASGPLLIFATVCFAFQIYCDFSAYSEIAKGVAQLFGISLMRNFAYPYFSQSLGEFWRRWHISLSTWFRDYVYIPLGGSKVSPARRRLNLLITFLVSGFWHGAAWRFLAWGAIHGVMVTGGKRDASSTSIDLPPASTQLFPHPRVVARILLTFGVVCVGWIFFRATSVQEGLQILRQIAADIVNVDAYAALIDKVDHDRLYKRSALLLCAFVAVEWFQRHKPCPLELPRRTPTALRWAIYTVLIWTTLFLVAPQGSQQFIYFEF